MSRSLVWFREDLRCDDHMALHHATQSQFEAVQGVYVITPKQWQKHNVGGAKMAFTLAHVQYLQHELARIGILLHIIESDTYEDVPEAISTICQAQDISHVFFNYEYPVNELTRDEAVVNTLKSQGVDVTAYHDRVIHPTGALRTQSGDYYKVFTPFKKNWATSLTQTHLTDYTVTQRSPVALEKAFCAQRALLNMGIKIDQVLKGQYHPSHPLFAKPKNRLETFLDKHASNYQAKRDYPALGATSSLSADLAVGSVSIRACVRGALDRNLGHVLEGDAGITCWISELIWRDFYQHILIGFNKVCKSLPFQADTRYIPWRSDEKAIADLKAWQMGQTGIPIVDAAMRQLNQTGYMHNRLRMVVAMFLTKNLLIDWHEGEQYFMQHLVDADFAANNGGWQWAASTGTDAAPYFRVFNPISQSQKFDPKGDFIRQYIPEIAHLDDKKIHEPYAKASLFGEHLDYPKPIVDLKSSRVRAIEAFKTAKAQYQQTL